MGVARQSSPPWAALARDQQGQLTRSQLTASGISRRAVRAATDSGRWQRATRHVVVVHSGPTDDALDRLWAAVLDAGTGAVAGPRSTLWLAGVLDDPPDPIDICIPVDRQTRASPGVVVRRRRRLDELRHPVGQPPRLRTEDAVLDAAAQAQHADAVVDLVLRAAQRRRTTAARLRTSLSLRRTHPWRQLLADLCEDVEDGVQSGLERRWRRDVELAHGLPRAHRNVADEPEVGRAASGRTRRYRDLRYRRWRLLIELDGREAHPDDEQFRDRARDNAATRAREWSLRYGWREVAGEPCGAAVEVAGVLRDRGWSGPPRPCSPICPVR